MGDCGDLPASLAAGELGSAGPPPSAGAGRWKSCASCRFETDYFLYKASEKQLPFSATGPEELSPALCSHY